MPLPSLSSITRAPIRLAVALTVAGAGLAVAPSAEAVTATTLSGHVKGVGGTALPGITVTLYHWEDYGGGGGDWSWVDDTTTTPSGSYTFSAVSPDSYRVGFFDYGTGTYLDEYWNDQESLAQSDDIPVAASPVTGIDATLVKGATISGDLTAPGGHSTDAEVTAYRRNGGGWEWASSGYSDDGHYQVGHLPAGTYRLRIRPDDAELQTEYWDDADSLDDATDVVVATSAAVTGRNARLQVGGTVTGRVTDSGGHALVDAGVTAYQQQGGSWVDVDWTSTDENGDYRLEGLPSTPVRIGFDDWGHAPEYWDDATSLDDATDVSVAPGATLTGRNAVLSDPGAISGAVAGGDGTSVRAVNLSTGMSSDSIVEGGHYSISDLAAGSYRVEFNRSSGQSLKAASYYDGVPEGTGPGAATSVTVGSGATTPGVDATLEAGGSISGRVVDDVGDPVAGCRVQAFTSDESLVTRSGTTQSDGTFTVGGLTTGSYLVAYNALGACVGKKRFYDGDTPGGLARSITAADPVPVTAGAPTHLDEDLVVTTGDAMTIAATDLPTIIGTARVGRSLEAMPGGWDPSNVTRTYQWLADGDDIPGATGSVFYPSTDQLGASLQVRVTATKPGYTSASAESLPTAPVAGDPAPTVITNKVLPTVTGTPEVGTQLTASPGSWSPSGTTVAYQWFADTTPVEGATSATFTPTVQQVGATVHVRVTASKDGYESVAAESLPTAAVTNPPPVTPTVTSTAPPTVSGTPRVGVRLSASPGSWTPTGTTPSYQWLANGAPVTGATSATFTPTPSQAGKKIQVRVTAAKAGHTSATATSASTAAVAKGVLTMRGKPVVRGKTRVGKKLTVTTGTWAPAATTTITWYVGGRAVPGAAGRAKTLKLTAAMVGKRIKVVIRATAAGYANQTFTTPQTAKVTRG